MSTIKVDTITTRTGSGSITVSNTTAGTSATLSGTLGVTGAITGTTQTLNRSGDGDLIAFQKGGADSGSISIESSGTAFDGEASHAGLKMFLGSVGLRQNGSDVDNTIDLGWTGGRVKDIYMGGGLYVGGTGAANKFEDYEEGTFTPTFNTTGGGESFTYTTQLGYYLKIGAFVWVSMAMGWSNRSGGSGQLRLGNLPFAPAGGSRRALAGMPYSDCWTGLSNAYNIQPHSNLPSASNGTYFWYTNGAGNIAAYIQSADLSSSGNLQTVLGYESSA